MAKDEEKELLTLAAKAAGYDINEYFERLDKRDGGGAPMDWNPLESDEDAFDLVVRIGLNISFTYQFVSVCFLEMETFNAHYEHAYFENHNNNKKNSARHAIVRCAAEYGRRMG